MVQLPILLVTTLAASVLAARLPLEKPSDGVYGVYVDTRGNEVHERLSDLRIVSGETALIAPSRLTTKSSALNKRELSIHCGCGFALNHGDCDAAVQNLKDQCGKYHEINPDMSVYAVRGNVVAFVCNEGGPFGKQMDSCSVNTITTYLQRVTGRCGWYIAGSTYNANEVTYTSVYGYMQWNGGVDFCKNALGSTSQHC